MQNLDEIIIFRVLLSSVLPFVVVVVVLCCAHGGVLLAYQSVLALVLVGFPDL